MNELNETIRGVRWLDGWNGWVDGMDGWDKMVYYEYEYDKKERQFESLD
jgi:hypothetical protein